MTKVFPTRWCTGPSWDPKNHFAIAICDEYYTLYIYTLTIFKKQIPPQKNTVSKWRSMIYFVSHHFNFGKNMKKHFSKGVFQWNLSHGFSGKSYFPASPKCWFMLISEKTTWFVWFIYLFIHFFQIATNKNCLKYSFMPRTVIDWNSIPLHIKEI